MLSQGLFTLCAPPVPWRKTSCIGFSSRTLVPFLYFGLLARYFRNSGSLSLFLDSIPKSSTCLPEVVPLAWCLGGGCGRSARCVFWDLTEGISGGGGVFPFLAFSLLSLLAFRSLSLGFGSVLVFSLLCTGLGSGNGEKKN